MAEIEEGNDYNLNFEDENLDRGDAENAKNDDIEAVKALPMKRRKKDPVFKEDNVLLQLPNLIQIIEPVKSSLPKCKGREAATLNSILKKYEEWAKKVAPALDFEQSLPKIEKCGSRHRFQHLVGSIRRGQSLPNVVASLTLHIEREEVVDEAFDLEQYLKEEFAKETENENETRKRTRMDSENSEDERVEQNIDPDSTGSNGDENDEITDEVLEMMRKKRLEALERRQKLVEQQAATQTGEEHPEFQSQPLFAERTDEDIELEMARMTEEFSKNDEVNVAKNNDRHSSDESPIINSDTAETNQISQETNNSV